MGAMEFCTPDKLRHACILAISRDIKDNTYSDSLNQWRKHILSTTTTFLLHESHEARYWQPLQARETIAAHAELFCRTTLQRIFEVVRLRVARINAVANAYIERLSQAKSTDRVSKGFIDISLTIHNSMIRKPRLSGLLLEADEGPRAKNPFDGITSLLFILQRCQTAALLLRPPPPPRAPSPWRLSFPCATSAWWPGMQPAAVPRA